MSFIEIYKVLSKQICKRVKHSLLMILTSCKIAWGLCCLNSHGVLINTDGKYKSLTFVLRWGLHKMIFWSNLPALILFPNCPSQIHRHTNTSTNTTHTHHTHITFTDKFLLNFWTRISRLKILMELRGFIWWNLHICDIKLSFVYFDDINVMKLSLKSQSVTQRKLLFPAETFPNPEAFIKWHSLSFTMKLKCVMSFSKRVDMYLSTPCRFCELLFVKKELLHLYISVAFIQVNWLLYAGIVYY